MGSDNGKLNRRSTRFGRWKAGSLSDGFRQWKAGSQEYQVRTMESRIAKGWVQTMESWIAGVPCSDNGKPNRNRDRIRRWKAGSSSTRFGRRIAESTECTEGD